MEGFVLFLVLGAKGFLVGEAFGGFGGFGFGSGRSFGLGGDVAGAGRFERVHFYKNNVM